MMNFLNIHIYYLDITLFHLEIRHENHSGYTLF